MELVLALGARASAVDAHFRLSAQRLHPLLNSTPFSEYREHVMSWNHQE